ncbi:hypothetical protein MASR2M79_04320 [Aminivibrio sp.]
MKPAAAEKQMDREKQTGGETPDNGNGGKAVPPVQPGGGPIVPPIVTPPEELKPKRFHGTVNIEPVRVGVDASKIAEEVIAHLAGLLNAKVTVTLEIEAAIPDGVPENVVRTVTENSNTLKFTSHGFERE